MADDVQAKIDSLPIRARRALAAYLVDHDRPTEIAQREGVRIQTIYKWIELAEQVCGVPINRQTRRGRPRSAA